MNDKEYMEDILLTAKTLTGVYHYATQESSTQNIHNQFHCNLIDSLKMQSDIFSKMEQKGWYPQQAAQSQQINQLKTKYSQN